MFRGKNSKKNPQLIFILNALRTPQKEKNHPELNIYRSTLDSVTGFKEHPLFLFMMIFVSFKD